MGLTNAPPVLLTAILAACKVIEWAGASLEEALLLTAPFWAIVTFILPNGRD
jgi:hypothetical protein